jgi:hypothetical protein
MGSFNLRYEQGASMSKMNDLVLDIEYLLGKGKSFADIARELEIPINFVVEANEFILKEELEDECSPFATINS